MLDMVGLFECFDRPTNAACLGHSGGVSNAELKKRLRLASVIVLVLGLGSGALIYRLAADAPDAAPGYVIANGSVYPMPMSDSKTYRREIQRFGGKAALLFDDFGRWFAQLWRGKTLGQTVAWLSLLAALGLYLIAEVLGSDGQPDQPEKRDEPG